MRSLLHPGERYLRGCLAVVLFLLGTAWPACAAGTEQYQVCIRSVDTSAFPIMKVHLAVLNAAGRPILWLPENALVVKENGRRCRAFFPRATATNPDPATVMLLFDISGSMCELTPKARRELAKIKDPTRRASIEAEIRQPLPTLSPYASTEDQQAYQQKLEDRKRYPTKLDDVKLAGIEFVKRMGSTDQVGIYAFDHRILHLLSPTSDKATAIKAIDGLSTNSGATALYRAMHEALSELKRHAGRRSIVVLTDGVNNPLPDPAFSRYVLFDLTDYSSNAWYTADNVIALAQTHAIPIYTNGFGDADSQQITQTLDVPTLQQIANSTHGSYAYSCNRETLMHTYAEIAQQMKSEYLLEYYSKAGDPASAQSALAVSLMPPSNPLMRILAASSEWSRNQLFLALFIFLAVLLLAPEALRLLYGLFKGVCFNVFSVRLLREGDLPVRNGWYCAVHPDDEKLQAGDVVIICRDGRGRSPAVYKLECWVDPRICNQQCKITGCSGKVWPLLWGRYLPKRSLPSGKPRHGKYARRALR